MTPVIMIDQLVERIKEIVQHIRLETTDPDIRRTPNVWAETVPKKSATESGNSDVPWVIVRYIDDEEDDESNLATVRIITGTFSEDEREGWRDILNVTTRIKTELLKNPLFGDDRFRIEKPFVTEIPEEQPFPVWIGIQTVKVAMPRTDEEGGYQSDVFW